MCKTLCNVRYAYRVSKRDVWKREDVYTNESSLVLRARILWDRRRNYICRVAFEPARSRARLYVGNHATGLGERNHPVIRSVVSCLMYSERSVLPADNSYMGASPTYAFFFWLHSFFVFFLNLFLSLFSFYTIVPRESRVFSSSKEDWLEDSLTNFYKRYFRVHVGICSANPERRKTRSST